ncbi:MULTISPECIES: sensor histidine kinase [unclassified Streptomyces]|uniref:sensor histidine kinase n=1 Tax=unclassified Streptomyces TaxID=2593676 RepID=UPI00136D5C52|nr:MULTISPECIES: sensor histidine kinase [unclassified Streptomyces]NEA02638.1 sensor histidine kinase [Streptomyces sp. SID10116]MYY82727.1 histidine kinase [Streptomyces sp. SID335]MYZ14890.1 histidine kinase [Streptomyces sp. SID337]NDZ85452.1 sensor histidine kinase [Streptomyces sp. SID10115]NEB44782.1 sensor histidine kinase [Streptomyces sp. SID339]
MPQHHLRFAPEILARLGEELVPHADLGIMELVRNSYDADAKVCHLQMSEAEQPGGTLIVSDNGDGMTADQLANGFLLIGKSGKSSDTHTPSGRRKVGEKGLGRIAALRLGTHVTVRTRSKDQLDTEHSLTIDWDRIDASDAVEDVPLAIESRKCKGKKGTTVEITGLREAIAQQDADRLARSVLMLTGPFADGSAFRVTCDSPEFTNLAKVITADLLQWVEFRLVAELDEQGQASATLYNWRGEVIKSAGHSDVGRKRQGRDRSVPLKFSAPPAAFEMWMFNLNPGASKEVRLAQQPTEEIKRWLKQVGGVHLYHRELRVQPYGDVGNDWLVINLRRAASPEGRASTNNSVGRIRVEDPRDVLQPKTDRSGFVDNLAFTELQEFAKRALDWSADQRLELREQRRVGAAPKARDRVKEAEKQFRNLMEAISPKDPDTPTLDGSADSAVLESFTAGASEVFDSQRQEIEALREDLLLYRTLATVGTSTAVFAHEAMKPAARIINEVKTVSRRVKQHVSEDEYKERFHSSVENSIESAKTLETFARLPLTLLTKNKRQVTDVDFDRECPAIVRLFSRYLDERGIQVEYDLDAEGAIVRSTIADIESILSNLIVNAAHAFTRTDAIRPERAIRVRTRLVVEGDTTRLCLCVDDSGPGIKDISLSAIWLPGKTTRDNGTGLGLTIVRDIVADLGGTQEAREYGELGGARIMVWLPAQVAEGQGS